MVLVWSLAGRAVAFAFGKQVARTPPPASLPGASTFQFHVLPASLSDRRSSARDPVNTRAKCGQGLILATPARLTVHLTAHRHNHIPKYCDASEERTAAIRFESPDAG